LIATILAPLPAIAGDVSVWGTQMPRATAPGRAILFQNYFPVVEECAASKTVHHAWIDKPLGHNALAAEESFKRIRQCACAVRWKFRNPEPPIDLFPEEPALYKSQGMTDFLQPKRVSRPIATRVWFHEDCLTGQRALDGSSV
jgi:hypothetical protein